MSVGGTLPAFSTSGGAGLHSPSVPRFFQFGVLVLILGTGAFPQILHALIEGVTGEGANFAVALVSGLLYDLLRIAPLVVLARHRAGILHPIIIAIVLWPLMLQLPTIVSEAGGYAGLLKGEPLRPPFFDALAYQDAGSSWIHLAQYHALQILSLLSLYGGFAIASTRPSRHIRYFSGTGTEALRNALVAIIVLNLLAVAAFIQLRGGLIEHIAELAFGRFRALEGLGPLLALFDLGVFALLVWIAFRPQDARSPLFVVMLIAVVIQQFLVAGSRSSALTVLLLVSLGWAMAAGRIPWRLGLLLLPAMLLSFGALNLVRQAGVTGTTATEAVQDATLESVIERSQSEFDARQSLSGSVPVIADSMRTTGLMWGYTYTGAVFAMVPRALWPQKPRGPGSIYAQTFLGETREGTAIPISGTAEAFWNFHIPGVILLFALHGALLRRLHKFHEANSGNGVVIGFFLIFATQFGVSTDQLVAFQQSILTFGLMLGMLAIFHPASRRGAPDGGAGATEKSQLKVT